MLHHYVMIPWSHGKREEFDFDRENQSATILSLISAHELHFFFFLIGTDLYLCDFEKVLTACQKHKTGLYFRGQKKRFSITVENYISFCL